MIKFHLPQIAAILLFLTIAVSTKRANAQAAGNTEDVILQISNFNYDKQINTLTQQLYNYKGAKIIDYCHSLEVLMLRINRDLQPDDTKMFEALKSNGYLFYVKENASIEKVKAACRDKTENAIQHHE